LELKDQAQEEAQNQPNTGTGLIPTRKRVGIQNSATGDQRVLGQKERDIKIKNIGQKI